MHRLKYLAFAVFFLITLFLHAQAPLFAWAKSFTGTTTSYGSGAYFGAMTVDNFGNSYEVGHFGGIVDFDPGPASYTLNSAGSLMYLVKLDAVGNFLWAKTYGVPNSNSQLATSVALDEFGNIIIGGSFWGIGDFDPGPGTYTLNSAATKDDIFILKLDPAGNFIWVKTFGGANVDHSSNLVLDSLDNIYMTGTFRDIADFDPGPSTYTIAPAGLAYTPDVFIVKFDLGGNFIWARSFLGVGDDSEEALSLDKNGNVFVSGIFLDTCDFDPGPGVYTLTVDSICDIYVTKLSSAGNFIWAKQFSSTNRSINPSLAIESSGNCILSGCFYTKMDADPGPGVVTYNSPSPTFPDMFVCKLDASGNYIWSSHISSPNEEMPFKTVVDPLGTIYITGQFRLTVDFDPGAGIFNMSSFGNIDVFLLRLDPLGNFLGAQQMGGANVETGRGLKLNASGELFVGGFYNNAGDYDPSSGTFNLYPGAITPSQDVFVVKLLTSGVATAIKSKVDFIPYVSPNPSSGTFSIHFPTIYPEITISIRDVTGKLIEERQGKQTSSMEFNLNAAAGLYFLTISDGQQRSAHKLIKQ